MRALEVTDTSGPGGIQLIDIEPPGHLEGHVLVRVEAVAATFPDLLMSKGLYQIRPALPFVTGSDFAGTVIAAPEAAHVGVGQRVAGFVDFGAAAEVINVPVAQVYPLPDGVSLVQGSAMAMNYLTAHFALAIRANATPGDWVLVHGAAGGVGIASIQVARGLGARVISVASTERKCAATLDAGADHAIRPDEVPLRVKELTGGRGVDIVVDPVGGDMMADSLRSLAPFGRVMVVGFASGEIPMVKVNRLLLRNIDIRGVEQSLMVAQGRTLQQWRELTPLIESKVIAPIVNPARPITEFATGLRAIDERKAFGRLVFTID